MHSRENYTVELFLDVDPDGTTYAEAILIAERHEPRVARGSWRSRPTGRPHSSTDFRHVVAGALSDLASTLTHAVPARPDAPRGVRPDEPIS